MNALEPAVLILVVMDDALVPKVVENKKSSLEVLILVVMDDALVLVLLDHDETPN